MRNQFVAVGILAGSLMAAPAFAQHTAPNQQPADGDGAGGADGRSRARDRTPDQGGHGRRQAAPGRHLPGGLTAQEAKPDAVGASKNMERWVEFVQRRDGQGTRSRQHRPPGRSEGRRQGRAAAGAGGQKSSAPRQRIRSLWINKARELLPDPPPDGRLGGRL